MRARGDLGRVVLFIKVAVEAISVAALGGLVLILAGVALASGERLLRVRARARAQEEPA